MFQVLPILERGGGNIRWYDPFHATSFDLARHKPRALAQNAEQGVSVPGGFMTGRDYLELGAQSRAAYAAGFFNGMTIADAITRWNRPGQLDTKWVDDCGKGISAGKGMSDVQIAEILRQYIQNRPTDWNHALNLLGINAMLAACQTYILVPPAGKH